jgi:phosphoribosyl-dephospho-CoA transferase
MPDGCDIELPWRRHELLRIAPCFWARVVPHAASTAEARLLAVWADRGWPVIVRRPVEGDPPDLVPVGLPLPPAAGKRRIALLVPREEVVERSLPPSLRAVRQCADRDWRPAVDALLAVGAAHGVAPLAIGSLFWEYRTGLPYLSARSDIDVLWPVSPACNIVSLLAGIAAADRMAAMRIDGEVVFPEGGAVNWRELFNALTDGRAAQILVKSMDFVRLHDVACLTGGRRAA